MQNIDVPKNITSDEENFELASKGPASLDCILDAPDIIDTQTGFQSDPETQRIKQKTRSRFSAAFRRLSKSTRKKENPISKIGIKQTAPTQVSTAAAKEESQTVDTHINGEKSVKKKSSLSKRFLLGGLKRTKSSSKKPTDVDESIILVSNSGTQTTNTLERRSTFPTQHSQEPPTSAVTDTLKESHTNLVTGSGGCGGSLQRLDRIRKVQITIRGKKIEHTQSEISVQTTGAIASSGGSIDKPSSEGITKDKDYLTPTETEPSKTKQSILVTASSSVRECSPSSGSSPSKGSAAEPKAKSKKKLKSKKITSSSLTKETATTTTTKTTKTTNNKKVTETTTALATPTLTQPATESTEEKEKYVITRSVRDTPPHERAPAKPSRAVAASLDVAVCTVGLAPTSQSSTGIGAIQKSTTKTTATLTSPSLTTRNSLKSAAAKHQHQKVQQHQKQQKSVAAKSSIIKADSLKSEAALMQNLQGGIERGHRFPTPSTPTINATAIVTETLETTSIATGNEIPPTISGNTPAIEITDATTTISQRQRQIEYQSLSESKTLSLSSSSSPEQANVADITLNNLQAEHRSSSPQPPTYPPPPIPIGTLTPEIRSSAHRTQSPLPSEQLYLASRFLPVASAHNSDLDEAISSAESAQQQHSYARNFGEISFDSNKSSESQSPISETSRRRIRYVAQPTLYDDEEEDQPEQDEDRASRPESRREALTYLYSAVSDYSLDSDEGDQTDNQQMPAFGNLTMEQGEPPIMSSTAEKREHLYKILVIGELGTGKTSFIKRYVHQFFSQNYRATIGVDFALKVLHWDANTIVRLQLWDIAGQERFGNMTRVYYKEAVGAFIVFDVTRSGTFDCVTKWKEDLDSKVQLPDGSPIPCILLANKCDQDKQGVVTTPEKMDEYVRENGFAGWFETSAKENINIDEAARALVNKILLNDKLISAADIADSEKFNLNNSAEQSATETKSKCSC